MQLLEIYKCANDIHALIPARKGDGTDNFLLLSEGELEYLDSESLKWNEKHLPTFKIKIQAALDGYRQGRKDENCKWKSALKGFYGRK